MSFTLGDLLAVARRFYPAGVECCTEAYDTAEETLRRFEHVDHVGPDMAGPWKALKSSARDAWPQYQYWDATYLRLDPCFKLRLLTTKHPAPERLVPDFHGIRVVLSVSALAPVHAIYTVFTRRRDGRNPPPVIVEGACPETVAEVAWLDEQARLHMKSDRLTNPLLEEIVPDVVNDTRRAGEATVVDCLFGVEKS
ncbi:MAG TPA: hypothetical protein VFB81_19725 [Myxococcales bacterium]|nr:hypothetical protein [Myxococcales bacterium]